MPLPVPTDKTLIDRLMRFAEPGKNKDDCWSWSGCKVNGYGRIRLSRKLEVRAHRLSYAIHYECDPGKYEVCHSCDNPECTNPKHLFLGTHSHNIKDAVRKGRWIEKGKGVSRNAGEANGQAKLTDDDVRALRAEYRTGGITQRALGLKWGDSTANGQPVDLRPSSPHRGHW